MTPSCGAGPMRKFFHKLTLHFAILLVTAVIGFSTASYADDPLCDAGLWTQMTQRARLNGQQDLSTAENLIYKADSILEYTCLEQFSNWVPTHVSYYMNPTLAGGAVNQIIDSWIQNNYGHTYLGGRNGTDPAVNNTGDYNCNTMDYVWKIAKCMHAGDLAPQDNLTGVYEFLTTPDSRMLPSACTGPAVASMGNAPVVAAAGTIVLTAAPTGTNCGTVIPTGNVVNLTETRDTAYVNTFPIKGKGERKYNEKICSNPVCHYVPTGLDAGSCQPPQAAPAATP